MAGGTATIKTVISLDKTRFESGMRRATAAAGKFGKALAAMGVAAAAVAITAATVAVVKFATATRKGIVDAAKFASTISDISANTGIAAGELVVLTRAFEDAGISSEGVAKSVASLNKAIYEAQRSPKSTYGQLFDDLGLNPDALAAMEASERFSKTLQALSKLDVGKQQAIGSQVFARTGKELGALINNPQAIISALMGIGKAYKAIFDDPQALAALDKLADLLLTWERKKAQFFTGAASVLADDLGIILGTGDVKDFTPMGMQFGKALQRGIRTAIGLFGEDGAFTRALELSGRIAINRAFSSLGSNLKSRLTIPGIIEGSGPNQLLKAINLTKGVNLPTFSRGGGDETLTNNQMLEELRKIIENAPKEGEKLLMEASKNLDNAAAALAN